MTICEPLKDGVLLNKRIEDTRPERVLMIFWHGVGDLVMFLPAFDAMRRTYPEIDFRLGVPKGLTYRDLVPEALELTGDEVNNDDFTSKLPFELVAKITFPMNEGQAEYTKTEWCCLHELGITPVAGHGRVASHRTPLVAVHFQITCLPDSCNPDRDTACRIWDDVLRAGLVPLEVHFQHIFHNPVNQKFDFIDATVRRATPRLRSLEGVIAHARAFVGVVSGPFHVALSTLGPERCLLLEKDFKREHFTKHKVARADLRNYGGEVYDFLKGLT